MDSSQRAFSQNPFHTKIHNNSSCESSRFSTTTKFHRHKPATTTQPFRSSLHIRSLSFSRAHSHTRVDFWDCLFNLIDLCVYFFGWWINSGIAGFDESYLPRWIGYAFASLLLLNHFLGSHSITIPQLVRFHYIYIYIFSLFFIQLNLFNGLNLLWLCKYYIFCI